MNNVQHDIYLNACGMVSALGCSKKVIAENLFKGSREGIVQNKGLVPGKMAYVGDVSCQLPEIDKAYHEYDCRNNQLILAALEQIKNVADKFIKKYGIRRIAVILGTSTSGILEGERAMGEMAKTNDFHASYHYRQQEIGTPALFLRDYLGLKGIAYTMSTACSSSAKVFASASRLLRSGFCDVAIIGGSDSLCRLTVNGFSSLESVAAEYCNPLSKNRDGINIGEGAALFVVSHEEGAIKLLGTGESSDAYHVSAPDPTGDGAERAMRAAMIDANIELENIIYINLHGTATPKNDEMECLAVHRIFGTNVPCSSTKPLTGHTLGAAGAIELGLCWLTLSKLNINNLLPPQVWDKQWDRSLPRLNVVEVGTSVPINAGAAILSNSFAFGGNNATVIIGKHR